MPGTLLAATLILVGVFVASVAAVEWALRAWWVVDLPADYRVARRRAAGRCQACGYDLRATPERCPECGSAAFGTY